MKENDRPSYTIIISGGPVTADELQQIATTAATDIACQIDDGHTPFDVDVVEGTFGDPLNGDNIHGLGRKGTW